MKTSANNNRRVARLEFTKFSFSPPTYRGNVRTTRAPIPSDFVYRAYEILKRRVGYASSRLQTRQPGRQSGKQAGRQTGTVASICVAIRAGRTMRVCIYTLGASERAGSGAQPPGDVVRCVYASGEKPVYL